MYNVTLILDGSSAVPSSTRVSLFSDGATWTVFINKTCSDTFYHWTSDTELTNCVVYVRGVFFHFKNLEIGFRRHYSIAATKTDVAEITNCANDSRT